MNSPLPIDAKQKRAMDPFRRALLRGLAVLLPPLLTIVILVWIWNTVANYLLVPMEGAARRILVSQYEKQILPASTTPDAVADGVAVIHGDEYRRAADGRYVPADHYERVAKYLGDDNVPASANEITRNYIDFTFLQRRTVVPVFLCLFLLVLYLLGKFMAAGAGRFFWLQFERLITRLPLVRNVYSSVKQVTDFVFSERDIEYTRVVAVEYPRKGIWQLAFVTGESLIDIAAAANEPVLTVFFPCSPVPFTGFTAVVKRSETLDLNITMEQAIQFMVSCGVVAPPRDLDAALADRERAAAALPSPTSGSYGGCLRPPVASLRMTIPSPLRIGTRGSKLARWQSDWVAAQLRERGVEVEVVEISTRGDLQPHGPIADIGVPGAFTKEIQSAVLAGEVDLAVHSLKDLPTQAIDGLTLAAVPPRENPADALVAATARSLDELPTGARLGTGSLRRRAQLLNLRPDFDLLPIRGNVDTRLRKLDAGEFDAIVLAAAGLIRLDCADRIAELLQPPRLLPAPGQGALGLECRADDAATLGVVAPLDDPPSRLAVTAERAALAPLHGGCSAPIGAWARFAGTTLALDAVVAAVDGRQVLRATAAVEMLTLVGEATLAAATELGRRVAAELSRKGAIEFIDESRAM